LNVSDISACGMAKTVNANAKISISGSRRTTKPIKLETAMQCSMPNRMNLSGKTRYVASDTKLAAAHNRPKRRKKRHCQSKLA